MEFIRGYAITVWSLLDPVYYMVTRLTYLDRKEGASECIFRVRLTRYKGRTIVLSDGTQIKKNDVLVKIHLHNVRILKDIYNIENDFQKVIYLYKKIQSSLPYVAEYLETHHQHDRIKGIIGITLLNKGCRKLGFEPHSIHNRWYKLFKLSALLPISLLTRSGNKRLFNKEPQYLMMSKNQLCQRYKLNK
ncbi:YkoP family protein [Pseudalkalibacillus sp. SCS-8]|uniref:YkoP family protein n=1 Tax=Pseudalkalibacillus nanhaiensis TaxID=3115291 RepID=UPI0032DB846F